MEHNFNINVTMDEQAVIYKFLSQDLSMAEDYTRQYIDNKTLFYGYEYTREVVHNGKTYIVNLRVCDTQEGRNIRCLRILDNEVYHYISLENNKDIEQRILCLLPKIINPRKYENDNIESILKDKRYHDLEKLSDNPYFVKEIHNNDWFYRAEYESVRLQLINYLESNKETLTKEDIEALDHYINKFKNNDKVIYERQFDFYYNGTDNSTLEKVFVKR